MNVWEYTLAESRVGSHASYHRKMSDGGIVTTTVVLSKREIPKSTLRKILRQLDISVDEFLDALGKRGR